MYGMKWVVLQLNARGAHENGKFEKLYNPKIHFSYYTSSFKKRDTGYVFSND